jgi:hypothetical protein
MALNLSLWLEKDHVIEHGDGHVTSLLFEAEKQLSLAAIFQEWDYE